MSADHDNRLFSTEPLPPGPRCEHDSERRWCNNIDSNGRLCSDIQAEIDLGWKPKSIVTAISLKGLMP
jgi:hypothetical protein